MLIPEIKLAGVEINVSAYKKLLSIPNIEAFNTSILDFNPIFKYDITLIKTVLIHISPEFLPKVYEKLYLSSQQYIIIAEYYNPTPVEVEYRGHKNKLFKRDFAGEMLDIYPDLCLKDYGFTYHRDPLFEHDDLNWFLLEKI